MRGGIGEGFNLVVVWWLGVERCVGGRDNWNVAGTNAVVTRGGGDIWK